MRYNIINLEKVKWFKKETEIENIIAHLQSLYHKINPVATQYHFLRAKIFFVIFEYNHQMKKFDEYDISRLKEAYKIFQEAKSYKLECKALIKLAELYEKQPQESLTYARMAMSLSKSHSIKELEKEIKSKLMSANTLIRQEYQNKFYFLTCYPLRDQPPPVCGGVNFARNLREEIMHKLTELDKSVLVHFDTFSSKMVHELIEENVGCKLLVLDFLYLPHNELILEEQNFKAESLEIDMIRKMVNFNPEDKVRIDILMVISDESSEVITKFADACEIPVTIYFDFKKRPANTYDIMVQYLRREFMYNFMKLFTAKLVSGLAVNICINQALQDALENIYYKLRGDVTLFHVLPSRSSDYSFETFKETFTVDMLEKVVKDCVKVHERGDRLKLSCDLGRGKVKDTSTVSIKDSLYNIESTYLRRDDLVVELYDALNRDTWVNLYGPKGIGKTTFICQFLNEVKKRNLYPEGEYLIRMSDLGQNHDGIKELLKAHFGEKFDLNMNEYFKGTKKLIVIDDFSKLVNGNKYKYPTFFLRALRLNNIHTVFITRQKHGGFEEIENCVPWQLKPLTRQQSLSYLMVNNKKMMFRVEADISRIENSNAIVRANGEPVQLELSVNSVLDLLNYDKRLKNPALSSKYESSNLEDDFPANIKKEKEDEEDGNKDSAWVESSSERERNHHHSKRSFWGQFHKRPKHPKKGNSKKARDRYFSKAHGTL